LVKWGDCSGKYNDKHRKIQPSHILNRPAIDEISPQSLRTAAIGQVNPDDSADQPISALAGIGRIWASRRGARRLDVH
jgi:hypothetical protein